MNRLFLFVFLSVSAIVFSQNEKFKLKSLDYGVGIYKLQKNNINYGFTSNVEISGEINSNIISANIISGFAIQKERSLANLFHFFVEADLLYGREFSLSRKLLLETSIGPGYIIQTEIFNGKDSQNFGFSSRVKLKYPISDKLTLGLNPNVNLNKYNNIYSLQLLLQFKFSGKQ